jgi:uncharacterized protein
VRILFDNGAGGAPGHPVPGFEQSFSRWPVPGTRARSWYFGAANALTDGRPPATGSDSFTSDKRARPATDFSGATGAGGLWGSAPNYRWTPNPVNNAGIYVTQPLTASTVVVGAGSVRAWIKSAARDVDLQATVSEVRPDGNETFVQSGWLRTSVRKLRKGSSLLTPQLSLRRRDARPLPKGRYAQITIPLYYQGHAYRAGSRIRVTISAVGGDQPVWAFADAKPSGSAKVTIAHSDSMPSKLLLPVVEGVDVPTGLPPCPGLRGEPCRTYTGG